MRVADLPSSRPAAPPSRPGGEAGAGGSAGGRTRRGRTAAACAGADDILGKIERLADLHGRGILTAQEFEAKKAELLGRL